MRSGLATLIKSRLPQPAARAIRYEDKDMWGEFTSLALAHNSVNLGQGFPNFPAPDFIKDAACKAILENKNQYAPSKGIARLRQILGKYYNNSNLLSQAINVEEEVLITQGANQGIAACMQAFIEPSDEVILFEPYFDIYRPSVEIPGGKVVTIPFRLKSSWTGPISSNEWQLDMEELRGKITKNTKALLLNNPHNPTGKLFTKSELEGISKIAQDHNLLVFSDEVYDSLCYDNLKMEKIANLPGMWDRTITFGSAGKTFGVTGWRIGWIVAPSHLIRPIFAIHSRTVFTTPTPLQEAVATAFEHSLKTDYFEINKLAYQELRDKAVSIFRELGLPVTIPMGSYFFLVNTSKLKMPEKELDLGQSRDFAICRWLTRDMGVTPIPTSCFYSEANKILGQDTIRICFSKDASTLDEAKRRLEKLRPFIE